MKKSLRRPGHKYEENIKRDIFDIGYKSVDWIQVGQRRGQWRNFVNAAMDLNIFFFMY